MGGAQIRTLLLTGKTPLCVGFLDLLCFLFSIALLRGKRIMSLSKHTTGRVVTGNSTSCCVRIPFDLSAVGGGGADLCKQTNKLQISSDEMSFLLLTFHQ